MSLPSREDSVPPPKVSVRRPGSDRWNLASTTFPDAGPMVRIPLPPVEGLQGFLFEIDEAEIVVHEADDPNTVVDLLDAEALTGEHG